MQSPHYIAYVEDDFCFHLSTHVPTPLVSTAPQCIIYSGMLGCI